MTTFRVYDYSRSVAFTDCVQLSLGCGRQELLDPWAASGGFARFRVTSSNSTNLANINAGDRVYLEYGPSNTQFALIKVLNKIYTYGNKSANNTYEDDYCELQFEGTFADWGRTNAVNYTVLAAILGDQQAQIGVDYGISLEPLDYQFLQMREYVATGTLADWAAIIGTTTNAQLDDRSPDLPVPLMNAPQYETPSTLSFSDTTTSATQLKIEAITFSTIGNNTYDEVILTLNGGPIPVVAIRSGASQPYRILSLDTLWADSNQALDYANWLLYLFQDSNYITSVTFSDATQTSPNYRTLFANIGKQINVTFRGTTYTTVLEGLQFDAVPGDATTTAYLSTGRQVAMFILDSSTRGVLDTNRLGY